MRFDIGPGGAFVILVGLVGLSGAVFALGLVAGHELAGDEAAQQTTVAYPIPARPITAPSAQPSNVAAAPAAMPSALGPSGEASPRVAALPAAFATPAAYAPPAAKEAQTASAANKPASSPDEQLKAAISRIRKRVASHGNASTSASATEGSASNEIAPPPAVDYTRPASEAPPERTATRAPAAKPSGAMATPPVRHQPYSVQIDAIMDQQGAQQMVAKLKARGFEPYIVHTTLNGQTWYRVRVGHYSTPGEAKAAEARLHQEFGNTPGIP